MLEVKDLRVYNLEESIVASGFPMSTGEIAENFDEQVIAVCDYLLDNDFSKAYEIGEKHVQRAIKLANTPTGSGHSSFLAGIRVSFNLKYPEYISPQLQRYHWFDIVSSESKMHRLTHMDIKNSCNKYLDDVVIDNLNFWIDVYNRWESTITFMTKYEVFMKIISNCPAGLEKWMHISTNYQQLRNICKQREGHPLKEDYGNFIEAMKHLPLANELLGVD